MADATVVLDIIGRDHASKAFDSTAKSADKSSRAMEGIRRTAKLAAVAIAGLAVKVGIDSVHAYADAQTQQTKLADSFRKFKGAGDISLKSLQAFNSELGKKTRFDDDSIASGQAVLAQFVDNGRQLKSLTPLLIDYAAKTGQTVPAAASAMGKAFLGNTRALKSLGINYKATGDRTIDMANITELMREKVGGFATKEGKTAAGQAVILKNQFGEVEESIGAKLVPALTRLAQELLKVIGFIQRNGAVIGPVAAVLGGLAATVFIVSKAVKAWSAAQAVLNVVMSANPIALVIIAIAALAVGLIYAYKKSETFRNIVNGAMHAVQVGVGNAVGFIIEAFHTWLNVWLTVADAMISGAAKALGWIPGLGGKLKKANKAFDEWRTGLNATLDGLAADARGWGENVATGLAHGISAKSYLAVAAAGDMANKVNAMANDQFKNHSPSKVAFQIGEFFSEGLALGIKKGGKKAIDAVAELTSKVTDKLSGLKDQAAGIMSSVGDSIRGVIDIGALGTPVTTQDAAGNDVTTTPRVTDQLSGFAAQAGAFAAALAEMARKKLAPSLIAAVAAAGPLSGMNAAQAFASLSTGDVASSNASLAAIDRFAGQTGTTVLKTTRLPDEIKDTKELLDQVKGLRQAFDDGIVGEVKIKGDDLVVVYTRAKKKGDRRG